MDVLEMTCDRCKVASYCSKSGYSPLNVQGGFVKCRIIGGYGKKPVDLKKLSQESVEKMKDGKICLTIAEVPELDIASGFFTFKVVKIFNPPILHEREKTDFKMDMMYPKTFDPSKA